MATYTEADQAKQDGFKHLNAKGKLLELNVIREDSSYVLEAIYEAGTLKGKLKDPVFINSVKVIIKEADAIDTVDTDKFISPEPQELEVSEADH